MGDQVIVYDNITYDFKKRAFTSVITDYAGYLYLN